MFVPCCRDIFGTTLIVIGAVGVSIAYGFMGTTAACVKAYSANDLLLLLAKPMMIM